jgi:hypothetical protein
MDKFMQNICDKHKVKLMFLSKKFCNDYAYFNRACCVDNNEIQLGIFDCQQKRLLAFFHELSHCLEPQWRFNELKYDYEKRVWRRSLIEAIKYGIIFSYQMKRFAIMLNNTYKDWEKQNYLKVS